jgi:hypothetical protein
VVAKGTKLVPLSKGTIDRQAAQLAQRVRTWPSKCKPAAPTQKRTAPAAAGIDRPRDSPQTEHAPAAFLDSEAAIEGEGFCCALFLCLERTGGSLENFILRFVQLPAT